MTDLRETIARALYEHWVAEDFGNEYAGWERLGDKQTWFDRADAVIAVLPDALKLTVVKPLDLSEPKPRNLGHRIGTGTRKDG